MPDKVNVSAEAVAAAGFFSAIALGEKLQRLGVLKDNDLNEVFAFAASMCRGNGSDEAASVIELTVPSSVGIDVVALAEARGDQITRST